MSKSEQVIRNKMRLYGINTRLKENKLSYVCLTHNPEKDECGWEFKTEGGHSGKYIIGQIFEYQGKTYTRGLS